jgi:hypothetical protein
MLSSGAPSAMKTSPLSVRQPGTPSSVKRELAELMRPKYWFSASFSGVILFGSVSA